MKLTAKQKNILESIRHFMENKKENPTPYKLHKHLSSMGVEDSLKSVMQVIEALERKELIARDESRRIYLVENGSYGDVQNIFSIPLFGLASCGEALAFAEESGAIDDFLQVSKSLFYRADMEKLFAVKALGDSMNRENINDGDYVIFEKYDQQSELEGKIVVAVINGMATIKRFKRTGDGIIALMPHSTNHVHHPIYLSESDTVFVAGVFRKVLPVKFVTL